jgi:hypothetical protein
LLEPIYESQGMEKVMELVLPDIGRKWSALEVRIFQLEGTIPKVKE